MTLALARDHRELAAAIVLKYPAPQGFLDNPSLVLEQGLGRQNRTGWPVKLFSTVAQILREQSQRGGVGVDNARPEAVQADSVGFQHRFVEKRGGHPNLPHEIPLIKAPAPTGILAIVLTRAPEIKDLVPGFEPGPPIETKLGG